MVRVIRMFTWKRREAARRKRAVSKPSMPKAFTTRKPEIVSCRISEMSRHRRSDVSLRRAQVPAVAAPADRRPAA